MGASQKLHKTQSRRVRRRFRRELHFWKHARRLPLGKRRTDLWNKEWFSQNVIFKAVEILNFGRKGHLGHSSFERFQIKHIIEYMMYNFTLLSKEYIFLLSRKYIIINKSKYSEYVLCTVVQE